MLSKDVLTGEQSYNKVIQVYEKYANELIHIETKTGLIRTTATHLFYTDTGWWQCADNLSIGSLIQKSNGEYEPIIGYERKQLEQLTPIYNINVEHAHTYYVSNEELLVHNDCDKAQLEEMVREMGEGTGKVSIDALKDAKKWLEALTQPELQALRNYQTGTYKKINQALREGLPIDGDMLNEIKNIDSAIGKGILTQDEIFYRGFTNKRLIENWEQITKGSAFEFVDNGFTSTSKQISVANSFAKDAGKDGIIATIRAKKGTNVANLEALNTPYFDEAEILIERGLNYKVVKAWEENGVKKVILEVE